MDFNLSICEAVAVARILSEFAADPDANCERRCMADKVCKRLAADIETVLLSCQEKLSGNEFESLNNKN